MSDTGRGEEPNPEHQTTPEAPPSSACSPQCGIAGMDIRRRRGLLPRPLAANQQAGRRRFRRRRHDERHARSTSSSTVPGSSTDRDKANLFRAWPLVRPPKTGDGLRVPASASSTPTIPPPIISATRPETFRCAPSARRRRPVRTCSVGEISSSTPQGESFAISEARGGSERQREPLRQARAARGLQRGQRPRGPARRLGPDIGIRDRRSRSPAASLKPVRGRMTAIDRGQSFEVIVDYAHTPSSFQTVFPPLRARVKGRMICVFGSGGERDVEKRPSRAASPPTGSTSSSSPTRTRGARTDGPPRGDRRGLPRARAGRAPLPHPRQARRHPQGLLPRRSRATSSPSSARATRTRSSTRTGAIPYDEIGEAEKPSPNCSRMPATSDIDLLKLGHEER